MSEYPYIKSGPLDLPPYLLFQWDIEDNLPTLLQRTINRVVVIGAWRGEEIISFLKWPHTNIWAFEPNPKNFQLLKDNFKNDTRVRCFNLACGEKNEVVTLFETNLTGNDSILPINETNRIKVVGEYQTKMVRFDSFPELQEQPIGLLWIDTQGFELPVLSGASGLLKNTLAIFVELNEDDRTYLGATKSTDLEKFLLDNGFNKAHEEMHQGAGVGVALFLRNDMPVNLFEQEKIDERLKKIMQKRKKEIWLSNNPLSKILRWILPIRLKTYIKSVLRI